MTGFRREVLDPIPKPPKDSHAGLWLDKFLKDKEDDSKRDLVKRAAEDIQVSDSYKNFHIRWRQALEARGAVCKPAKVLGRLAINLGAEGVLETAIALHHTYGVPYIPGSALKGLASHYAMNHLNPVEWGKKKPAFQIVFGDTSSAGYINFYDALYIPGSGYKGKALWPDVITVHHPDYYQSGKTPPADWDSPTPIPFLTATGNFLIALEGVGEWVEAAFEILKLALKEEGIGAKTSSGYGRMIFMKEGGESITVPPSVAVSFALQRKEVLQATPPPGRVRGTVVDVRENGRYGKINPSRGGAAIRVHTKQLRHAGQPLVDGQVVEYRIGSYQGNPQAEDVEILLQPDG